MAKSFDAQFVRHWAAMSLKLLKQHRNELNALNVFPVPDGDTGTNLYLSLQSAVTAELHRTGESSDLADTWRTLARGALLGARGNSGVILAGVFSAMARAVELNPKSSLQQLLQDGALAARQSVHNPVEGTALSVLDAVAKSPSSRPDELAQVARAALARTPEQLPALKEAGVVDAGGRGVVLLLDALSAAWAGAEISSPAIGFVPDEVPTHLGCKIDAKFELMFLVPTSSELQVKDACANAGTSLVISAGEEVCQIHIHLDHPNELLEKINQFTKTSNIQIELLDQSPLRRRMIAPIFGNKLVERLLTDELVVIAAEPNQRPSVQDFVSAGLKSESVELVLFASDPDTLSVIQIAAKELQDLGKTVELIPTTTLMQTLAAVALFSADSPLEQLVAEMKNAADSVTSYAIAQAQRVAQTQRGSAQVGDWVLAQDHKLIAAESDLFKLLQEMPDLSKAELITVLVGAEFSEDDLPKLKQSFGSLAPQAVLEILLAGQQVWSLLIGVE